MMKLSKSHWADWEYTLSNGSIIQICGTKREAEQDRKNEERKLKDKK